MCSSESRYHLQTWISSCTLHYCQSSQAMRGQYIREKNTNNAFCTQRIARATEPVFTCGRCGGRERQNFIHIKTRSGRLDFEFHSKSTQYEHSASPAHCVYTLLPAENTCNSDGEALWILKRILYSLVLTYLLCDWSMVLRVKMTSDYTYPCLRTTLHYILSLSFVPETLELACCFVILLNLKTHVTEKD